MMRSRWSVRCNLAAICAHPGKLCSARRADARAVAGRQAVLVLVQVDADRQVEGVKPGLLEVVAELLDARCVRHRRAMNEETWRTLRLRG